MAGPAPDDPQDVSEAGASPPADALPRPVDNGPFSLRWSTFWSGFWLAVACVGGKFAYWWWPDESTAAAWQKWFDDMGVITCHDLIFALGAAVVVQLALVALCSLPKVRAVVWYVWMGFAAICVFYVVVSAQVFVAMRTPLTYSLIYLAGDPQDFRSSLTAYVNTKVVIYLIASPIAYLSLVWACQRYLRPRGRWGWGIWAAQAAILSGVYFLNEYRDMSYQAAWRWRSDHRLTENPHWVLMRSLYVELRGGETLRFDTHFPPEFKEDFQTIAEKPAGAPLAIDPAKRPKNVILLVLESVGKQHLSLYGSPYATTPRLNQEASNALVLENYYAPVGYTASCLISLTISTYPGITWRQYTFEAPHIRGVTLPQLLGPMGYRSAFISAQGLKWALQDRYLAIRGFDQVVDMMITEKQKAISSWGVEDRYLIDRMLKFVDEDRSKPFFVMAWTAQTHHPYDVSPDRPEVDFFNGEEPYHWHINKYLNCLLEADRQVGRLIDGLRERKLDQDTLLVIVGDHGEAFGRPHPTYFHGHHVFQENVGIPCILWNPRLFGGGKRDKTTIAGHVDLVPTIADLLGIAPSPAWQGRSFFDTTRPLRAYFFAADHDYMLGVREGQWKYIYNVMTTGEEIYDLESDPTEQSNVAKDHGDLRKQFRQRLSAWVNYQRGHMADLTKPQ